MSFKDIKFLVKNHPTKKTSSQDNFSAESYQIFKEKILPIAYKTFKNIENEGIFSTSFYEENITLVSKQNIF